MLYYLCILLQIDLYIDLSN